MLEKPDLPEESILAAVRAHYGLQAAQLSFLPLGADVNTAVYRILTPDRSAYFLKLRRGAFAEISVNLPLYLKSQGVRPVIAPLQTISGGHWAHLEAYRLLLYPFIDGKDGYELELTERQWVEFGAALHSIHSLPVPPELALPRETYPPDGREAVTVFQAQAEKAAFADPTAAKLAAFMKSHRAEITHLVTRAGQLADLLQSRPPELVICHADLHPGNLLLTPGQTFYIVDWDDPILAPKEKDLMFIGGYEMWNDYRQKEWFYQGYGPAQIDPAALAYYRYERIVQDIAAFCRQLFLSGEGGDDREQSYGYFTGQFLPHHEVAIARQTDRLVTY